MSGACWKSAANWEERLRNEMSSSQWSVVSDQRLAVSDQYAVSYVQ